MDNTPDPAAPDSRKASLAELLESIRTANNPEQVLLHQIIDQARTKNAQLAEAIRYCAIPHRFNAALIGVLRNEMQDHEENKRLIAALRNYEFVLPHRDGGYVYHDVTREILLQEWQDTDEEREAFNQYNRRLATFFNEQLRQVQNYAKDLASVSAIVHEANPNRYIQLFLILEKRVVAPMLEALYHETLRSAEDGYALLQDYFGFYERRDQLTVCESLLNAMRTYLRQLPPDHGQDKTLRALRLYDARLALRLQRFSEAESILRELNDSVESDAKLKFQVLGDLVSVYSSQFKLREAQNILEAQLAMAPEAGADAANLSLIHYKLGTMYLSVLDLDQAINKSFEALDLAKKANNRGLKIYCLLMLGAILNAIGKWDQAANYVMEAFHEARIWYRLEQNLQHQVALQCMELLSRRDPTLLDTLFYEAHILLPITVNTPQQLTLIRQYADFLLQGGQQVRAEALLSDLQHRHEVDQNAQLKTEILSSLASIEDTRGAYEQAIRLKTEVIHRAKSGQASPYDHALALADRGAFWLECGKWDEAMADLKTSTDRLEEIGHSNLAVLVKVIQARAFRKQGNLEEAQRVLDESKTTMLASKLPSMTSRYHQIQGEVYSDLARWSEADDQYKSAFASNYSINSYKEMATFLGYLADVNARQAQWDSAAKYGDLAGKVWSDLAAINSYIPTPATERANQANAKGMSFFSKTDGDSQTNLTMARDLFHSAVKEIPDNIWYHLNLAYTYAALKQWDEAVQEAEIVLGKQIEWVHPIMYVLLVECSLQEIEKLWDTGQYEAAGQKAAAVASRLENTPLLVQKAKLWLIQGDILFMLKRPEEARSVYEAALAQVTSTDQPAPQQALFNERLDFLKTFEGDEMQTIERKIIAKTPKEWFAKESITLLAPDGQANIISSSEPLDASIDTHQYAAIQGDLLRKEFPGYQEFTFEPAEIMGGHPGYIRRFEWTPPDGVPVTQIQLYYAENGRGYTTTATTPSSQYERFELQFKIILESLMINEE